MVLRRSLLRLFSKAGSIVLLWTLPASISVAMPAAAKPCAAKATTLEKLVRQVRSVRGPLAKKSRGFGIRRHPQVNWIQGKRGHGANDDEQAIQNDAPAADAVVELDIELRLLGEFVDPIEQHASTRTFSPRAPRGPPPAA